MTEKKSLHIDSDVKAIIRIIKIILKTSIRKSYILLFIFVVLFFLNKKKNGKLKVNYTGNLTFMINQNEGISGELGPSNYLFDLGYMNSGGNSSLNPNRIRELSRTRLVISKAIFKKITIGDRTDYLANFILEFYEYNIPHPYYTFELINLDSFSRAQNSVLNSLVNKLNQEILSMTYSESGIFTLRAVTLREELSKNLVEAYYEGLSEFYINKTSENEQISFNFLDERLDSLDRELKLAETRLAVWEDRNRALIVQRALVERDRLFRNMEVLQATYLETLKSHQVAKLQLNNQTPIFQIIDPPSYPLAKSNTKSNNFLIMGSVATIALYFMTIIGIFLYKSYGYLLEEILSA